ncbi:MAG: hypothetical protein AAF355_06800 [Myxococcota bacterium]
MSSELSEETLDYDELYREYLLSLVNTLRGFGPATEGLDLWVPDEDLLRSTASLLDAAVLGGRSSIKIRFGLATVREVDPNAFVRTTQRYGKAELTLDGAGWVLSISGLRPSVSGKEASESHSRHLRSPSKDHDSKDHDPSAQEHSVHLRSQRNRILERFESEPGSLPKTLEEVAPAYRESLRRWQSRRPHRAPQSKHADGQKSGLNECINVSAELEVVSVTYHLTKDFVVMDFTFHSDDENLFEKPIAAALNAYGALVKGLPFLEVRHHGTLRLEHALREPQTVRPVPGIVTLQSSSTIFHCIDKLAREAFLRLERKRPQEIALSNQNTFDMPVDDTWASLKTKEREQKLTETMKRFSREHQVTEALVASISSPDPIRAIVGLRSGEAHTSANHGCFLMQIERFFRQHVDPRIEVFAEERSDRNKIRRLAIVTEQRQADVSAEQLQTSPRGAEA